MRADKDKVTRLLKTARGQIEGMLRMVEEDRYCIDLSTQLLATEAVLRTANREVLRAHMHGCLREALETGNAEEKLDEVMKIIDKLTR